MPGGGWCAAVRVQDGRAGAWLSLGDLVNRARTVYGQLEPEATGAGLRQSTAWADDLTSQGIYGVKEGQYSLDLASTTQAKASGDRTWRSTRGSARGRW